jgi:hypothetical protein
MPWTRSGISAACRGWTSICSTRLAFSRRRDASSVRKKTDRAGGLAPPLAILSYELWQTVFGGQPLVRRTGNVEAGSTKSLASADTDDATLDRREIRRKNRKKRELIPF